MDNIDFVIPWVDGSDSQWLKEKQKYSCNTSADASVARYRDWDLLRYWFRGVEKFAPWVNKIHFITYGHIPNWLNTEHNKLNIVLHEDYIPNKYLPTFSANTIELNLHRIMGLSEKFVYFNDDFFLIAPVIKSDFFKGELPVDTAALTAHCFKYSYIGSHFAISDVGLINDEFDFRGIIKRDLRKWLSIKYGFRLSLQTLCLMLAPRFPGFWQHHLPQPYSKKTFAEVWERFPEELDETCIHKFRSRYDVNQWLIREWNICKGEFKPRNYKFGKSFKIQQDDFTGLNEIAMYIKKQKGKCIAINDNEMSEDMFNKASEIVKISFQSILGEKSKFEKEGK